MSVRSGSFFHHGIDPGQGIPGSGCEAGGFGAAALGEDAVFQALDIDEDVVLPRLQGRECHLGSGRGVAARVGVADLDQCFEVSDERGGEPDGPQGNLGRASRRVLERVGAGLLLLGSLLGQLQRGDHAAVRVGVVQH